VADPKKLSELALITGASLTTNMTFYLIDPSLGVGGSKGIVYSELLIGLKVQFYDVAEVDALLLTKSNISHTHAFADLTAKPTTLAGYGITDAAPLVHTHAYSSLTGIPATFAPSAHGHTWAEITGEPTTLAGYGITDAAPLVHTHDYATLTNIPATFTPAAHNQAWSTITATPTTLAGYGIVDAAPSANVRYVDLHYTIDGGGSVITSGAAVKGVLPVDFNGQIDQVTVLSADGLSGAIVIDVKKSPYSTYPTWTSICASAKPTITATGNKAKDSALTGWTKGLASGDILGFFVDSVSTFTRA
jgi:hypothetical protein